MWDPILAIVKQDGRACIVKHVSAFISSIYFSCIFNEACQVLATRLNNCL